MDKKNLLKNFRSFLNFWIPEKNITFLHKLRLNELIEIRKNLQKKIDAWHKKNKGSPIEIGEYKKLLSLVKCRLLIQPESLEVEENGKTFRETAIKKVDNRMICRPMASIRGRIRFSPRRSIMVSPLPNRWKSLRLPEAQP